MSFLAVVPGLAQTGPFDVQRSSNPAAIRSSAAFDQTLASPYDDAAGTLSDANSYFYLTRDSSGQPTTLSVDKERAQDRVRISFNDGGWQPSVSATLSTVSTAPATIPADGVTISVVTIVPRDASGQMIGSGLQLTIDAAALAPGVLAGPVIDQGDGTYIVQVLSSQIGQGLVEVTSAGTLLDTQPTLMFASLFTELFSVTSDPTGPQQNAAAGQATDGGSVMAWQGDDGSGSGIFARVFDANGMPLGVEFAVNTTSSGEQTDPALAVAGDRSFVVVWVSADADGSGIYAQRYDSAGQPSGNETRVNFDEVGNQTQPDVAMADDGSFVVVWQGSDSDSSGIFACLLDNNGLPLGNEFLVNSTQNGPQDNPVIAIASDGRFAVLWTTSSGANEGVYAQPFSVAGVPVGAEIYVDPGLIGQQGLPAAAIANSGLFTVVWRGSDANGDGILARSYDALGLALSAGPFIVNTDQQGKQHQPDIAMADDGVALVVWTGSKEIRGQRFDANGAALGAEFTVSDPAASKPERPSVSLAGDGTSYLVLYEAPDASGSGVFAAWIPL